MAVARQLARVEARKLAGSVWFVVGVGFLGVFVLVFGVRYRAENVGSWSQAIRVAPWFAHPFVGMMVFAAFRMARRPRRDGTAELFSTCPAEPSARTSGLLRTGWVGAAGVAAMLLTLDVIYAVDGKVFGPFPAGGVAVTLAAAALGVGGVALGVALGEWIRFPLAPLLAVLGVAVATLTINNAGDPGWNPFAQLSTAPPLADFGPVYGAPSDWWHLVWVVALAVLVAAVARIRHDRSARAYSYLGVGVLVATISGVLVTRPLSASDASGIAARISDPSAHTHCAPVRMVRVCTFPGYETLRARVVEEIAPVAAALPTAIEPIVVRHVFDGSLNQLPPEVRRLLPAGVPPLDDREVVLGFEVAIGATDTPSLAVAFAATGLPRRPDHRLMPLAVSGQARGVVALWLGTRGTSLERAVDWLTPDVAPDADPFQRGSLAFGDCEVPSVVWSEQDLAAARTIVQLPEQLVRDTIVRDWARWIDPTVGTDELLAALGLASLGPYDMVVPQPGNPC